MEIKNNFIYSADGMLAKRKSGGTPFCVSSLLPGETIADFIEKKTDEFLTEGQRAEMQQQISDLKAELTATDYISLKAFEGGDVSNHPNWKEHRQALRDEINRLEKELM